MQLKCWVHQSRICSYVASNRCSLPYRSLMHVTIFSNHYLGAMVKQNKFWAVLLSLYGSSITFGTNYHLANTWKILNTPLSYVNFQKFLYSNSTNC